MENKEILTKYHKECLTIYKCEYMLTEICFCLEEDQPITKKNICDTVEKIINNLKTVKENFKK